MRSKPAVELELGSLKLLYMFRYADRYVRQIALALALASICVGSSVAQTGVGSQVELGTFGTFTKYDEAGVGLDREFGVGARLGIFLNRALSLETSGDHTETRLSASGDKVNVTRIGGTLVAHGHLASWSAFYLGAGYERMFFRGAINDEDDGAHVIVGERLSFGTRAALRIEGRGSFYPPGTLRVVHLSASVGLSLFTFGGRPRDGDGDRVADSRDRCPDTLQGASVDPDGCPSDTDADRVLDGLDACPDTPAGAIVDPAGCPSDDDNDGVWDGIDKCPDTPDGATADTSGCPSDSDLDGVPAGLDRCPDTPEDAVVDPNGCPLDGDGDGVYEGRDQCPDTPDGVPVDEIGCPSDSDGDGLLDAIDECPGTPPGTEVDQRGCEIVADQDGDGVPDSRDRCPNTTRRYNVDDVGCPVLFVIEQGQFVNQRGERGALILRGVNFALGRSVLTAGSHAILDDVVASLLTYPKVRVEIAGHTDATGTNAINGPLSLARARAVMAYLARNGVRPERMEARGYGPGQPIATNSTRAGRARNRRVELRILQGG